MAVTANRIQLKEVNPGYYRAQTYGFILTPGSQVVVEIKAPGSRLIPRPSPQPLIAEATIVQPMSFLSPKPDAHIKLPPGPSLSTLRTAATLHISWNGGGGVGAVNLYIYEFKAPKTLGRLMFQKDNLMTNQIDAPLRGYIPGKKYGIYISRKMADFRFKGRVHTNSRYILSHSVATYFHTE
jgi:hypothetical protein